MSPHADWWSSWAPYWDRIEDRHLSVFIADRFSREITQPCLVIGSGQGLVVEHLRGLGLEVDGIDLDPTMVELARERRGVEIALGNAEQLPYEDNAYRTTIVATGVVDYLDDEETIARIISEAHRVTRPRGDVLIAFYRVPPKIEGIYKNLGVMSPNMDRFHLGRIFDISRTYKKSVLGCVPKISGWTGKNRLSAFVYWSYLGMTLPGEMKRENSEFNDILTTAAADGVDEETLYAAVPDSLPYRDEARIASLLTNNGMTYFDLTTFDDCTLARHRKFELGTPGPTSTSASRGDPAVTAQNLVKRYGGSRAPAVNNLSITVDRGSIYGLLGPNGAGKTTTLSMLCGLLRPDSGTVDFADAEGRTDLRQLIGFVPQDLALYPKITARDNMVFFGKMYGLGGSPLRRRVDELLDMVGLLDRAKDLVQSYSTGMMRRLNLAAGLIHHPRIIFMDEPTVGIDPQSRNCIFEAVEEIKSGGATVLYTTHYMEEASRLCDRIGIMDRGRVILEDNPREAVDRYGHLKIDLATNAVPDPALAEALCRIDAVQDAMIGTGRVTVYSQRGTRTMDTVAGIQRVASEMGTELTLRSVVEPNLESLFLDITGKSLRDEV